MKKILLVPIVFVVLLAGCGGGGSASSRSTRTTTTTTTTTTTSPPPSTSTSVPVTTTTVASDTAFVNALQTVISDVQAVQGDSGNVANMKSDAEQLDRDNQTLMKALVPSALTAELQANLTQSEDSIVQGETAIVVGGQPSQGYSEVVGTLSMLNSVNAALGG
jgi:hypothetical protein